jgi:hypothetical protein
MAVPVAVEGSCDVEGLVQRIARMTQMEASKYRCDRDINVRGR